MMLLMGRITRDYLINHRLTPYQCAPNLFKVLGRVDAFNKQMGLGLTWYDVVHMYKCYKLAGMGYYLKSQSEVIRLISCLPRSNKGIKDDYLIVSGEWNDDLYCPTRAGEPGGVLQDQSLWQGILAFLIFLAKFLFFELCLNISSSQIIVLIDSNRNFLIGYFLQIKIMLSQDLVLSMYWVSTSC